MAVASSLTVLTNTDSGTELKTRTWAGCGQRSTLAEARRSGKSKSRVSSDPHPSYTIMPGRQGWR